MITFYKDNDIVGLAHELASRGEELSEVGLSEGVASPTPYMVPSRDPFMGRTGTPFMGHRCDP